MNCVGSIDKIKESERQFIASLENELPSSTCTCITQNTDKENCPLKPAKIRKTYEKKKKTLQKKNPKQTRHKKLPPQLT